MKSEITHKKQIFVLSLSALLTVACAQKDSTDFEITRDSKLLEVIESSQQKAGHMPNIRHESLKKVLAQFEKDNPQARTAEKHHASQTAIALATHEVLCEILHKLSVIQIQGEENDK